MQRYFAEKKVGKDFILKESDLHHILHVMRMKSGEEVEVVYEKELYLCEVEISSEVNVLEKEKLDSLVEKKEKITLVLPLLKEQKMDFILQKSTELGVDEIIPLVMERSMIKFGGKEEKKLERWRKIVKEASEQSKRITIPNITEIRYLKDLKMLDGVKFVCSTREKSKNLKNFLTNHRNYDKMIIVIGPEGGLSSSEEEKLIQMGFDPVTLGTRILRVETVPLFLLSILNYIHME